MGMSDGKNDQDLDLNLQGQVTQNQNEQFEANFEDNQSVSTAPQSENSAKTLQSIAASEQLQGKVFKGYIKFRQINGEVVDLIILILKNPAPGQFHLQFQTTQLEEFYKQFEFIDEKGHVVNLSKLDQMVQNQELNEDNVRTLLNKLRRHMLKYLIQNLNKQDDNQASIEDFKESDD
eukprot:403338286